MTRRLRMGPIRTAAKVRSLTVRQLAAVVNSEVRRAIEAHERERLKLVAGMMAAQIEAKMGVLVAQLAAGAEEPPPDTPKH